MASRIGMSYRNEAAQKRIDAALPAIIAASKVDIPDIPGLTRDAVLNETLRLEWTADVLDGVRAALGASDDGGPDLNAMTRAALNDLASDHGVVEPDKLPNKDAVIAAIEATAAETPEGTNDILEEDA